jgi:hypothetical protein
MAARIDSAGNIYQLDRQAEPDERVTEEDVKDADKLARLLMRVLKDLASIKRRFFPRRVDFEDTAVDGSGVTKYRFPHGLNARVRWWPVDVTGSSVAALRRHADTDLNTLVLLSDSACTVTIRVEAAG